MNPKYPIYIVSKKRWDTRLTVKVLEEMQVPYNIIVEKDEFKHYANVIDPRNVLITPPSYKIEYETLDNKGTTKSVGPGASRNFCWQHSIDRGFKRHWVMDDNIPRFYRLNHNQLIRAGDGTIFRIMEDFCDRYQNVAMAGPNYQMFVDRKVKKPPFTLNTRVYSCNLIQNNIPFRWRGRYNEDTILSLDILKAGLCTIQFNAFLQDKLWTQTVKGGNTANFYDKEGTLPKSRMQVAAHPDVSTIVWRYQRWHHNVDYSPFKNNKLIPRPDLKLSNKTDEYGLKIVKIPLIHR